MFTIVTFPFLFGIMFGDIGHGFLLSCFGMYLLFRGENMLKNTKRDALSNPVECRDNEYLYRGRYMFLMMGLFSTYCGFIYNDFFSISLDYSSTCLNQHACVPQFGVDGAWGPSINKLAFMNSMKMKLAIVIGVTHMLFGILLKGVNTIHYGSVLDFTCEFIP